MKQLPRYPECFICGRNNIAGTDITFYAKRDGVQCTYIAQAKHQSYKGILHGGIISALLDECMGWAVGVSEKQMCVTAELKIKFIKPVSIGTEIIVEGYSNESVTANNKYKNSRGIIKDKTGTIYAEGEGIFYPLPKELEEPVFSLLELNNDNKHRVTAAEVWG